MSDGGLTPDEFHQENAVAVADGMEVRLADDRHLLLDLDDEAAIARFAKYRPKLTDLFGATLVEEYESRSGPGHLHVILELAEPHPAAFRIALQAVLGSDPLRELLGLRRLANGVTEPSRLFRKRERTDEAA